MKLTDCKTLDDLRKLLAGGLWVPHFGGAIDVEKSWPRMERMEVLVKRDLTGYELRPVSPDGNVSSIKEACDNQRQAVMLSFDSLLYDGGNYDQVCFFFHPNKGLTSRKRWSRGAEISLEAGPFKDNGVRPARILRPGDRLVVKRSGLFYEGQAGSFWEIMGKKTWDEFLKGLE